jgi:hypothetical protein
MHQSISYPLGPPDHSLNEYDNILIYSDFLGRLCNAFLRFLLMDSLRTSVIGTIESIGELTSMPVDIRPQSSPRLLPTNSSDLEI